MRLVSSSLTVQVSPEPGSLSVIFFAGCAILAAKSGGGVETICILGRVQIKWLVLSQLRRKEGLQPQRITLSVINLSGYNSI